MHHFAFSVIVVLLTNGICVQKNEISKEGFVRHMRSIIGDQMLKMAVYKFQSQVDEAASFQLLHKKNEISPSLCINSMSKFNSGI